VNETKSNRDGIDRIFSRMKWYSSLSALVLDEAPEQVKSSPGLRNELEKKILGLYRTFLSISS
jgi:hypothetical protein